MSNKDNVLDTMNRVMDKAVEELIECGGVIARACIFSEGDGIDDCYVALDPWSCELGSVLFSAYISAVSSRLNAGYAIEVGEISLLGDDRSADDCGCQHQDSGVLVVHSMMGDCETPFLLQHFTCNEDEKIRLGERCFRDSFPHDLMRV
jgi:hypothetical protein